MNQEEADKLFDAVVRKALLDRVKDDIDRIGQSLRLIALHPPALPEDQAAEAETISVIRDDLQVLLEELNKGL